MKAYVLTMHDEVNHFSRNEGVFSEPRLARLRASELARKLNRITGSLGWHGSGEGDFWLACTLGDDGEEELWEVQGWAVQ